MLLRAVCLKKEAKKMKNLGSIERKHRSQIEKADKNHYRLKKMKMKKKKMNHEQAKTENKNSFCKISISYE